MSLDARGGACVCGVSVRNTISRIAARGPAAADDDDVVRSSKAIYIGSSRLTSAAMLIVVCSFGNNNQQQTQLWPFVIGSNCFGLPGRLDIHYLCRNGSH